MILSSCESHDLGYNLCNVYSMVSGTYNLTGWLPYNIGSGLDPITPFKFRYFYMHLYAVKSRRNQCT